MRILTTMRAGLLAALSLAAITPAQAGPDRIYMPLVSAHPGAADWVRGGAGFETRTPGVLLAWEFEAVDIMAGVYRNSFGKPSAVAAVVFPVLRGDDFSLGLFAGAAHYPGDGRRFAVHAGDVVPMGGLAVRYRNLSAMIMPSDGVATDAVVTFGLTFALE